MSPRIPARLSICESGLVMMRSATALLLFAGALGAQEFDLVVANGRVMDPASNLDAVRYVGIRAGKIAAVSESPLRGKTTVDARGLVVSPGFIDLHSHGQTPENYALQSARRRHHRARNGGRSLARAAVVSRSAKGRRSSTSAPPAATFRRRMAVMHDTGTLLPRDNAVERAATPAEQREILALRRAAGWTMAPSASAWGSPTSRSERAPKILDLFRLAAAAPRPSSSCTCATADRSSPASSMRSRR